MKKHLLRFSIIMLFLGQITLESHSQIAAWNNNSLAGITSGNLNATTKDVNLKPAILSRGGGIIPSSLGGGYASNNWVGLTKDLAIANGNYYQCAISAIATFKVSLSTLDAKLRRTGSGPNAYIWCYSLDGKNFTDIGSVVPFTATTTTGDVQAQIDVSNITALQNVVSSDTITLRLYAWGATGTSGTLSFGTQDVNSLAIGGTVKSVSATSPNIVVSTSALSFSPTTISNTNAALSYTVNGAYLTDNLVITATGPYSISDVENGTYTSNLSFLKEDVISDKTIFVKFSPVTAGTSSGTITHASTDAATRIIALSGEGIDPANLSFNFNSCTALGIPGLGFTSYSVTGAQKWACSSFGRNGTKGVDMNGYSGGPQENEDWLISPSLKITSLNLPVLRFWSRGQYSGPSLQLLVSTDYDGTSNPNSATWTDLQASFPPSNNVWTMTDGIDLSAYKGFSSVYIAFKYISSPELGATQWTIDDVDVTNRTQMLSASPLLLNFAEISTGNHSGGIKFLAKAIGYGDITLTAPTDYELSSDSSTYTSTLILTEENLQSGTYVFARFSPTDKLLKIEGKVRFTAPGLDSSLVTLTGSSYPRSETFDAGCYNLSFFGSNSTNNPTQEKIDLQVANIATVMTKLDLDIVGIEEVSNDAALASLVSKLPHHSAVISDRWSYSFNTPDPNFPPQKTGFIYDNTTTTLISSRDMFANLYDSVRNGYTGKLPGYPGGTPQSFWASGRLPFMATFDVTIQGVTKRIVMVDVHSKSGSDVASYNRRVYDTKVLYDSLKAYYSNDNVVLVGDYNDRVFGSITTGSVSPFKPFVDDNANFKVLTLPLDQAGRVSFLTGSGLIDHISITKPLANFYIATSTDIEDPRSYIPSYSATTASDHMPVYSRFDFSAPLPVTLTTFNAQPKGKQVLVTWATSAEYNSSHFVVERSADSKNFNPLGVVKSAGNSNVVSNYQLTDSLPLGGINYYRLKQVDRDGTIKYSLIVAVKFGSETKNALVVYPNPVGSHLQLSLNSSTGNYSGKIIGSDGKVIMNVNGDMTQINQQINQNLFKVKSGVYVLKLNNAKDEYSVKFIKQ